jgi:tetratricopeptide (TPR) repeat protein
LQEAAELNPDDPDIQRELGLAYRDLDQLGLAERHLRRALSLRSDFPEADNDLGTVYARQGKWDQALAQFQKVADNILYRTPHIAYNNIGSVYFHQGEYQRAIQNYRRAIQLAPRYSDAYFNLAAVYEQMGRLDESIEAYLNAIDADPNNPAPYFRLGRLYYQNNMKREAAKALEQFLQIVPDGPYADQARRMLAGIPH